MTSNAAVPFLILQPGMGAGIASRRTPRPGAARLRNLVNHGSFGLGLSLAARLASLAITRYTNPR